jgi:GNAT superfamily N-acetyltransferase
LSLRLRTLTLTDLGFADSLRAIAGWNQTLPDWERFLATERDGCFLAECNGVPAGTATTTIYGPELGWIGMVLVHPDFRRRGIGSALLQHSISYLRGCGVRCIKLDATPAGKMVYDRLGFRIEWTLNRWVGRPATEKPPLPAPRPWQAADAALVDSLDANAFGVSRRALLTRLAQQSTVALVLCGSRDRRHRRGAPVLGRSNVGVHPAPEKCDPARAVPARCAHGRTHPAIVTGFGFARAGSQALYLGPVVATDDDAGLRLLEALVARNPDQLVFWDIPDPNEAAVSWAQRHGFTVQRPLIRMFLGDNTNPGNPRCQFAIAGPEVG